MKKKILVLLTIILAGGLFLLLKKTFSKQDNSLNVKKAFIGDIAIKIRLTGSVQPRNRLEIKPQVGGRIEQILAVEGQKVRKGEIIGWLSSSDRAALIDVARSKGESELKKWEDAYKPTPIVSPLDGFIILRNKEEGQTVTINDVIVELADKLIVRADVDETDLKYIKTGGKVILTLDAYPETKFPGAIEHIAYESRMINNVTVYEVKILPVRIPENFRAGMTSTAELTAAESRDAVLVSYDAVKELKGKKYITVVESKNKKERRDVVTGISDGKNIEIISGINEGEKYLLQGTAGKPRSRTQSPAGGMRFLGGR